MRGSGSGRRRAPYVLLMMAVFGAACTTTPEAAPPPTSLTIGAPELAADVDDVIRYGIEPLPAAPWAPYRTSCATSCALMFGAVTDTLFATTTAGETVGLLVEQVTTNADSTVHTWRLRDGVNFSDGTRFDALAAKRNIDACRHSVLTGPSLAGIDDVRAEGWTLTITTLAPWGNLAAHFAETPCGHMLSAAWLTGLADLPMRSEGAPFFDAELAALPVNAGPTEPVGLGAFTVTEHIPGNGNRTLLAKNPGYWRGSEGITGEDLPQTDTIELVAMADEATRRAGFEAGQFDIAHSSGSGLAETAEALGAPVFQSADHADVLHIALNAADGPDNPLRHISCRQALVRAINRPELQATLAPAMVVDSPFALGNTDQPDESADSFDPTVAREWAERCVADHGADVALELAGAIGDPRLDGIAAAVNDAWGPATGLRVEVVEADPGALALAALLGEFELLLWEAFGGTHPDLHFTWWYSEAAAPPGALATNVSRIVDPVVDEALVDLRRATTPAETDRAAAALEQALDDQAWTVWLARTSWTVAVSPTLDVEFSRSTPDGTPLTAFVNGAHPLDHIASR